MTTAVADHVVAKVLESREYTGKFGPMKAYDLLFESGDMAELRQKPRTPAPQVGDALHGQIIEEYGRPSFKKITPGFEDKDARPATMANSSMGSAPLPQRAHSEPLPQPNGRDVLEAPAVAGGKLVVPPPAPLNGDARQWSIVRQHSQAMAIEMVRAMIYLNVVAGEAASMAMVRRLTDWFQADAEGKNPPDYTP